MGGGFANYRIFLISSFEMDTSSPICGINIKNDGVREIKYYKSWRNVLQGIPGRLPIYGCFPPKSSEWCLNVETHFCQRIRDNFQKTILDSFITQSSKNCFWGPFLLTKCHNYKLISIIEAEIVAYSSFTTGFFVLFMPVAPVRGSTSL